MPWTESRSDSFVARHESEDGEAVERLLDTLEAFRDELADRFERAPGELDLVVHSRQVALDLAQPWLPVARRFVAPAARRYMAGWFSQNEIHVLGPRALERRASGVPGSLEALRLAPLHELAHVFVGLNNATLPPPFTLHSFRSYLRSAWLCEGAATHFAGQTPYLRGAIVRRLHEGREPEFPPAGRDAQLLGGTVFSLLYEGAGAEACVELATTPLDGERTSASAAIERAFARPRREIERDWRSHLRRLTSGAPSSRGG
jgi:hypothetical protein